MTWLSDKLSRRIQFMRGEQIPNAAGGSTQTYKPLVKVWAGVAQISESAAAAYIRNVQIKDTPTHKFTVRYCLMIGMTSEGGGYIRADNFIFLLSRNSDSVGRLFKIITARNVREADEYVEILAKEMGQLDTLKGVVS